MKGDELSKTPVHEKGTAVRKKVHDFSKGPVRDEELDRWLSEVRYPNSNRVKRRFRRENEAWKWWNDEQEKIRDGTWDQSRLPKTTTFNDVKVQYLEWKRNTRSFISARNHLKPWGREFDTNRLSDITEDRIMEVINRRLDAGVTKGGVDVDLAWLKALYNWLERKKKYLNNPTKDIPFFRENDERLLYLTPPWMEEDPLADQFYRLIEACKRGPWFLAPIVILATFTGLRQGNCRGLKWSWVHLNSRTLVIPTTKAKGKRTITIPMDSLTPTDPIVYETLLRLHETRKERGNSEYVFPRKGRVDEPITEWQLDRAWEKARAESGIERDFRESHNDSFRFHDLRHTFASWHAMRGTDLYVIMRLLAHSSIDQTQRYAHLSPRFLKNDSETGSWFPRIFPNRCTSSDTSPTVQARSGSSDLGVKSLPSIH